MPSICPHYNLIFFWAYPCKNYSLDLLFFVVRPVGPSINLLEKLRSNSSSKNTHIHAQFMHTDIHNFMNSVRNHMQWYRKGLCGYSIRCVYTCIGLHFILQEPELFWWYRRRVTETENVIQKNITTLTFDWSEQSYILVELLFWLEFYFVLLSLPLFFHANDVTFML